MFSFKTIAEAVIPYLDASVADAVNDLADSLDNLVANADDNDVADETVDPQAPGTMDEPTCLGAVVMTEDGIAVNANSKGLSWFVPAKSFWFTWSALRNPRHLTADERAEYGMPALMSEAGQDATGPQKGTGRIGWLRLTPFSRFRYLAREVDGGWSDKDHDAPVWIATDWPYAVFTPLLPGFYVAPDGDDPAIWREMDVEPAMWRTPRNADFFDAVAGMLQTRDGEIAT